MKTKERILQRTLELYNEQGVAAVSSKTLSDDLGLSQGNLAYHFPRKRDLILTLFARREQEIATLFEELGVAYQKHRGHPFPMFVRYIHDLTEIVRCYRFVSIDLGYLTARYPEIAANWKRENETMAEVTVNLFRLGVQDKYLPPEQDEGEFARIIHRMQVYLNFWVVDAGARRYDGLGHYTDEYYASLLFEDFGRLLTDRGRQYLGEAFEAYRKEQSR